MIGLGPIYQSKHHLFGKIEKSKGIISKGVYYLIGDGSSMEVWLDPWVPGIQ